MGVSEEERQENIKNVEDGKILTERSCTDCPIILVTAIFVIGWIIILVVAQQNGKPDRMIRPNNFRGDLCGDYGLVDYPALWVPKPSRLSYGLCTVRCPSVGDYVCNNDIEPIRGNESFSRPNHYYTHTSRQATLGKFARYTCLTLGCDNATQEVADRYTILQLKLNEYKCFPAFYASGSTLFRCLPFQDDRDNATLASVMGESLGKLKELADYLGVGQFFNRGFAEMEQSWLVILLCSLTCCAISLLWIFLLRCIMKPLVYLCILLILVLLIVVGYLAMLMADDLEKVKVPGDTATDDQIRTWRALQYAAWILAAMYVILMFWMIKRIKIAIAIMREASYIFLSSPGLVIIPPIVFVFFVGWVAFFIITTVYIQTMGKLKDGAFKSAATDTFGETAVNFTINGLNQTAGNNSAINTTAWSQDENVKYLHAYNFFGFLWASTFCLMYGFFVTAMTGVTWYFSASQGQMRLAEEGKGEDEGGREKDTPYFTIPRCAWNVFRYHLGTALFGSLLIAIMQFVRVLFLLLKEEFLIEWQETCSIGCLIKSIECCLWYIAKVVEVISKNGFIITSILNTRFCVSASTAMDMIGANGARVSVLATLSAVACFVLKVFIVGTNMIIAWALINTKELTQGRDVESGLFPLCGILIISFIIASVFVNVYESLVDTVLMAFLIDEEYFGAEFMSRELAKLTDKFKGAEEARQDYEKKLRVATNHKHSEAKKE